MPASRLGEFNSVIQPHFSDSATSLLSITHDGSEVSIKVLNDIVSYFKHHRCWINDFGVLFTYLFNNYLLSTCSVSDTWKRNTDQDRTKSSLPQGPLIFWWWKKHKKQRWNLKSGGPKNLTCQRDIKAGERPTLADIWGREALTPGLVWEKGRFTGSDARKTMQAAWAASPAPRGSRWGLGRYWRYDSEPLGSVRLGWPAMTNVYKGSTVMSRD